MTAAEEVAAARGLGERFAASARAHADAVALTDGDRRLTYREVSARADALAAALRSRGVGPGDLVAVALPRSAEMVIAVAGVVRAGAAYLPLDLAHPPARLATLLADAEPSALVGDGARPGGLAPSAPILCVPEAGATFGDAPRPRPSDPAYVIYTSGSTGRPKGVVVTQRNVARLFDVTAPLFAPGPEDVWTLFHSIAFDFSVWEMWGALLHGGRLVVVPGETARAADAFHALVVRERVTFLNQTPSAFRAFDAADAAAGRPASALRHVVFGGEALDPRSLAGWFAAHGDERPVVSNMYGITETTVHVTWRRMRAADARGDGRSLVGAPLADLSVAICGADGRPVADGEAGEIVVGGEGVAAGYLRRPEATAERFVTDARGARVYRSGDRGRRLPGGDIEYLGRGDSQVKLRGFRIELGEIEAALRAVDGVRDAVAALREDEATGARIVAYFVGANGRALDPAALRAHLARSLPEPMLPSAYVRLEAIPRTVNEKLDRSALPAPKTADLPRAEGGEAPLTATEVELAAIWREVLGLASVSRHEDFIAAGGHSLLAIRVAQRVAARLGAEIGGLDVLAAGTLSALAARIDAAPRLAGREATRACAGAPATPGQVAVLLHQDVAGAAPVLNEPVLLDLQGPIDADRLAAALRSTLAAHPAFSTRFVAVEGVWRQEPGAAAPPRVEVADASRWSDREIEERVTACGAAPFDPASGDVARALVLRRAPDRTTLLLAAHHVAIDEWSVGLLLDELSARLRGAEPSAADPGTLANAARRADDALRDADADRAFWRSELDGAALGADFPPPAATPARPDATGVAEASLDPHATREVREALRRAGATEFEAGLAALALVLEHHAHRGDVTALVALADRDRREDADVVGYLLDVLPVRLRLDGDPTVSETLARTRSAVARTAAHRALSTGEALAAAGLSALPQPQGVSSVFYTRREAVAARLSVDGVRVSQRRLDLGSARFDLWVHLWSEAERLTVRVEHRAAAMDASAAATLARRIARLVHAVAASPARRLSQVEVLEPLERAAALAASRGPAGPPPPWPLVPAEVAARARAAPDAVAVEEPGRTVRYGELLAAADALAARLRALGVGPDDVVPVVGAVSAQVIAAWLGVLRAGAAYAPIDPDQPAARRAAMLADCAPRAVVAEEGRRDGAPPGVEVLAPPEFGASVPPAPEPRAAAESLAYVVFTSGSTGRPKGVQVHHAALAHVVAWHRREVPLAPGVRTPLLSGTGFDATVLETWGALAAGAALLVPDDEVRLAPERLRDWLVVQRVPYAFAPTILAESLLALPWPDGTTLRTLRTGGEALRARPAGSLPFVVVNVYGPAETAVWVTAGEVASAGASLPSIGRPIDDTAAYVVDHRGRIAAEGVAGEIWIGGPQVGRGYRGLATATAAAFPESELEPGRRERVYRTGDLARRGPRGTLEFAGRRDAQVKLRGVRIEIGEIEGALLEHPAVASCAVLLRGEGPSAHLAAFVAHGDRAAPSPDALSAFLAERLPRAMVPARWSVAASLPLSPNGKIDRRALAATPLAADGGGGPPRTDAERSVARIFAEVLGAPSVTRDADFFRLGGHSLLAVRIVARIEKEHGVRLGLRAIFEAPTVAALASLVEGTARAPRSPGVPLREGAEGAPLLCLPAIGGHAFQYRDVAVRMKSGRSVLALQLHDLDLSAQTLRSVPATADAFLGPLREVQPHGPYWLLGYSYGGFLALEIARRLAASGEEVAFLALLDTYAPGAAAPLSRLQKLRVHTRTLASMRVGDAARYLRRRAARRARRVAAWFRRLAGIESKDADLQRRIEETIVHCRHAIRQYRAEPFVGRVTVIRASRGDAWAETRDPTRTCGWQPLCAGGVDVVEIDCAHDELFREPHISHLAAGLDAAVERGPRA